MVNDLCDHCNVAFLRTRLEEHDCDTVSVRLMIQAHFRRTTADLDEALEV